MNLEVVVGKSVEGKRWECVHCPGRTDFLFLVRAPKTANACLELLLICKSCGCTQSNTLTLDLASSGEQ